MMGKNGEDTSVEVPEEQKEINPKDIVLGGGMIALGVTLLVFTLRNGSEDPATEALRLVSKTVL